MWPRITIYRWKPFGKPWITITPTRSGSTLRWTRRPGNAASGELAEPAPLPAHRPVIQPPRLRELPPILQQRRAFVPGERVVGAGDGDGLAHFVQVAEADDRRTHAGQAEGVADRAGMIVGQ